MFVEKSLEEISKMSIEDQTVYMAEKKENDTKVRKEEIESQIKDSQKDNVSKEEVSKLEDRLSEIKEVLISQSLELKGLREAEPLKNKNKGLRGHKGGLGVPKHT